MNKLTPEAVAAHAEAWPCLGGGLWRVEREGKQPTLLVLSVNDGLIMLWTEILGWQRTDPQPGWTITPVRPDGSDLPPPSGEVWSKQMIRKNVVLLDRIRALEKERDAAREQGRSEERAAIVAGVKQELDELRAEKSYFGPSEQAWTSVYARLKNGEWSAKP